MRCGGGFLIEGERWVVQGKGDVMFGDVFDLGEIFNSNTVCLHLICL